LLKVYAVCCYLRVILQRCAQRRMLYLNVEQRLFSPHRTKTGRSQQILLFHLPFVSRMLSYTSKRWMRFMFSSCSQWAVAVRQLLRHNYKTGYLNTVSRRYRSTTIIYEIPVNRILRWRRWQKVVKRSVLFRYSLCVFACKIHIQENIFLFTDTNYILLRPITTRFTAPALQFSQHPLRDA